MVVYIVLDATAQMGSGDPVGAFTTRAKAEALVSRYQSIYEAELTILELPLDDADYAKYHVGHRWVSSNV